MTLTKDALIEMIRDKVGYPVKEAKEILEIILEEIKLKLEEGKEVKISGFGKWTVKDVVQHVTDNERIMTYRALRVARGDATPLPGYEQDDYVRSAGATLESLRRSRTEPPQVSTKFFRILRPSGPLFST